MMIIMSSRTSSYRAHSNRRCIREGSNSRQVGLMSLARSFLNMTIRRRLLWRSDGRLESHSLVKAPQLEDPSKKP